MYVVLMAMLALNVSNEVLNGFSIVEESLKRTTENAAKENLAIYDDFDQQMKANPQKVKEWYEKAQLVKLSSDSLYNLAAELKLAIAQEADGSDGDPANIVNKEDLEAANQVMLAPGRGRGGELKKAIEAYREGILKMVDDKDQKRRIASDLTTEVPSTGLGKKTGRSICLSLCRQQLLSPCCRSCRVMCATPRRRCCTSWCRTST